MGVSTGYLPGVAARGHGSRDRRPREVEPVELRPQFRLRPGQDDALIEWLGSLAPRRRSAAIREALRETLCRHLASRQGEGGSGEWAEDPDLAAALDALF